MGVVGWWWVVYKYKSASELLSIREGGGQSHIQRALVAAYLLLVVEVTV